MSLSSMEVSVSHLSRNNFGDLAFAYTDGFLVESVLQFDGEDFLELIERLVSHLRQGVTALKRNLTDIAMLAWLSIGDSLLSLERMMRSTRQAESYFLNWI